MQYGNDPATQRCGFFRLVPLYEDGEEFDITDVSITETTGLTSYYESIGWLCECFGWTPTEVLKMPLRYKERMMKFAQFLYKKGYKTRLL